MNLFLLGGLSALGIVLMLALLQLIDVMQRKPVKAGPLPGRPEKSLKDFALQAGEIGISLRVARETYALLLEHYPTPMCIDPRDELRRDLHLTDEMILKLRSSLLKKTDRLEPAASDISAVSNIRTVSQLLFQVEAAQRDKIDRATLRLRASDCPYPARPAVEVNEFKPDSEIVDPDYHRRQHFGWMRRRLSDYKGLLSRATDEAPKQAYKGPFRRSYEPQRYPATSADRRNAGPKQAEERVNQQANKQEAGEPSAADSAQFALPSVHIAGPKYPSR